ncbi:sulfatase [Rubrivirga sp. S365]|uniref:Sulfatase n=1 Tax=Rubrivirga litoralis TaxID=3075598 RepID=A0ABU3BNY5_9BACT|nr:MULTISPECIES: sulfatase [unclassified Rubrivirga]MDT0631009.1 sulfatase [Rubrivirga sp. F394]MDT7855035.1 sulfatase [Rubrivirga sp. S365]
MRFRPALALFVALVLSLVAGGAVRAQSAPRNVVIILSDDHRYDFMGFMPQAPDFLRTPNMDRMAAGGAHVANAFVTTSLCSPSRASILTGQYAHNHGVVDNTSPIPEGTRFFPQDLQAAGYQTALIGKWHMGEDDDQPRPGFDRWVSFRGQGVYVDPVLNVDGERVEREGYTTDLLTDYALDFLKEQSGDRPFFLELSHKAVHAEFIPAPRHAGAYAADAIPYAPSMWLTEANYAGKPRWVREQRGSWHGVDFAYHGDLGPGMTGFDNFYRRYAETVLAVDQSVGRVLDYLEESGLAENTLVLYLGDNGFLLGEHGLIDKRNAYEESIRIPFLAWSPGFVPAGSRVDGLVRNLDIAPTLLEMTRTTSPIDMDGTSFLGLLANAESGAATPPDAAPLPTDPLQAAGDPGREFLYEYYWEYAFPHTPTTFALRGDRYKYITYHGVWDTSELYDLQADPREQVNLINVPTLKPIADAMRRRLFDRLEADDAMRVPMRRGNWQAAERLLYD